MTVALKMALKIADYHHRFGAFAIDWHIRTAPLAIWGFVIFFRWFPDYWNAAVYGNAGLRAAWEMLLPILHEPGIVTAGWLCAIAYLLYHPLVELAMHGDSPGKRMMGVRVVSVGGSRPSARQIIVRNLWRALEFLPMGYLWGVLAILRSDENARTGDVMAGTRVIMR